jgi:hypothetical protein
MASASRESVFGVQTNTARKIHRSDHTEGRLTTAPSGCCVGREHTGHTSTVSGLLIGYARVSTDAQDLTAQRDGLQALGVEPERIYVDHGLTGTHRDRPGLREARPSGPDRKARRRRGRHPRRG